MILITGATGHIGGAVVRQLLQKMPAAEIAALVRNPDKAAALEQAGVRIRIGDYDDTAALAAAMRGVAKVLLVSGGAADNGNEQHQNVVDAAKAAGVRCIAYTGRALKDPATLANRLMDRHFETEDYIRQSGLDYVFFRNALYMDVIPLYVGGDVLRTGIQLPEGRVAFALRNEMGEAIGNVLAADDCSSRTFTFTGSQSYSFGDVAAALSTLSGKDVPYTEISISDFEQRMRARGIDPGFLPRMVGFVEDIKAGQESTVTVDLEQQLGRPPADLTAGLKQLFKL